MLKFKVTGMFRSGTTLVGRMLHAHPRIALASDGTFPFYKFLRDALESGVGNAAGWGGDAPLADYYFNAHTRRTFEAIQSAILDLPIAAPELDRLRTAVARWCVGHPQYAPQAGPPCKTRSMALPLSKCSNLYITSPPRPMATPKPKQ